MRRIWFLLLIAFCVCTSFSLAQDEAASVSLPAPTETALTPRFVDVPEPPKTPDVPADQTYVIDLAKFGIQQGFPKKEKRTIDGKSVEAFPIAAYETAHANVLGMNRAIRYAVEELGAKKIVVPQGTYAFCYANVSADHAENCILVQYDNLILDFNGSTWKCVFDSYTQSPYDMRYDWPTKTYVPETEKKPYQMGGFFLRVANCRNTTVRNGIIIGDKIERAFEFDEKKKDGTPFQQERWCEQTYGVGAGNNCYNVVVENFDTSFFMGDGLTGSGIYCPSINAAGYQMNWERGTLTDSGEFDPNGARLVGRFVEVEPNQTYFVQGYGYSQGLTYLKKKQFDIFVYDANKKLLKTYCQQRPLREFAIPANGKFFRMIVDEKEIDKDGWSMAMRKGAYGSRATFRDNFSHHNHRGGMTIGVNDMLITRNRFLNNGAAPDLDYNQPSFPDGTRYHINMEDTQGHNIHIVGNRFEGGNMALCVRGTEFLVEDNDFIDCHATFYKLHNLIVRKNRFVGKNAIATFPYNHDGLFYRNWLFENNEIAGSVRISGNAPGVRFVNNRFAGAFLTQGEIEQVKDCQFLLDMDNGYSPILRLDFVKRVENCRFVKSVDCQNKNCISLGGWEPNQRPEFVRCDFERIKIDLTSGTYTDCRFADCGFRVYGEETFDRSRFLKSGYELLNNYSISPYNSGQFNLEPQKDRPAPALTITNCELATDGKSPIFTSWGQRSVAGAVTLTNSTIRGCVDADDPLMGRSVIDGEFKSIGNTFIR